MDAIGELIAAPLAYQFVQRGLLALVLVGGVSAVVGCFVIARGLAFFSDALAHAVLPGVALAWAAGANLFLGGLGAGLLAALLIAALSRARRLKEDSVIGLVFVTMFAAGIALISARGGTGVDLMHILFGSISGISGGDLASMAVLGGLALLTTLLFYKQFLIISFDPDHARALRLPARALEALLLALIAVTIVASLQAVGIMLMLSLLLTPPATARLLMPRMRGMLLLAALLGILSGAAGLYVAWYLNMPSGPAIVLTQSALFGLVFVARMLRQRLA